MSNLLPVMIPYLGRIRQIERKSNGNQIEQLFSDDGKITIGNITLKRKMMKKRWLGIR